jgi:phosphoglycolate phosphatase
MIGDTKLDLIAATKAGVKGVGVLCGYGKMDDLKQYTDMVYDTTYQAVASIKEDVSKNK